MLVTDVRQYPPDRDVSMARKMTRPAAREILNRAGIGTDKDAGKRSASPRSRTDEMLLEKQCRALLDRRRGAKHLCSRRTLIAAAVG